MKEGWEVKKLTDVCHIQYGYAFDSSCFCDDDSYPQLIRIRDVVRGYSETFYNGNIPEGYFVYKDDYLIGMDGEFHIAQWQSEKALLNQRVCKISATDCDVDERFIYYTMSVVLKQIEDETPFVTVKHLSAKRLNLVKIPIPPLPEQSRIVEELDLLSNIIEKKRQQLSELDNLAQSIFYDMFGDPITNEKGWEVKRWENVLTIINGKNQAKVENPNGEYPIYGSGGIIGRANNYLCPNNTIIIGRKGNINKPLFVNQKFWNVDTAFGLVSNVELMESRYLFFFCDIFDFEQLNKAVTIPSLTKKDLLQIEIPLPPLQLQQLFAQKIEAIEKEKELIKQSIKETEELFNSRMDYYFG